MTKVISLPTKELPTVEANPFVPKMAGIPPLPKYAVKDFIVATERFWFASFLPEDMSDQEKARALKDRQLYPTLLGSSPDEISQAELDAFILKVTGYSRPWLASWGYQEMIREFNAQTPEGQVEMKEQVDACYVEATSEFGAP